jgi:hypothetical protein
MTVGAVWKHFGLGMIPRTAFPSFVVSNPPVDEVSSQPTWAAAVARFEKVWGGLTIIRFVGRPF